MLLRATLTFVLSTLFALVLVRGVALLAAAVK
jgi:hypothetical protein